MVDFLCIGAQKAGTTWLIANLKKHPDVWTPPFIKELHYFDILYLGYDREVRLEKMAKRCRNLIEKQADHAAYFEKVFDPSFVYTDEWYRHVFSIAPRGAKKGECTPLYSAINEKGVKHVKRLSPKVKIIYLVRDPLDRAKSAFRMRLGFGKGKDKESALKIVQDGLFEKRGDYRENITLWDKTFPSGQILYLPFGRIKSDPAGVMQDVESFLGLSPYDKYPKLTHQVNATKKKGTEIDDEILGIMQKMAEPQYPFLKQRFGEEFFNQIA